VMLFNLDRIAPVIQQLVIIIGAIFLLLNMHLPEWNISYKLTDIN
jgi:hypothetical protein